MKSKTYKEMLELVESQAAMCKNHWESEITWLERCHLPNYHYGCEGQYNYHDYDLIGFCNTHRHIVYYGGGRRSSFDSCAGAPGSGWHHKFGRGSFSLKEIEEALDEL